MLSLMWTGIVFRTNSPISQSASSFLDQFCCASRSCNHRHVPSRHLVVLCTRFLLKLASYTITDTLTTGCSKESSISCSILTKVPWTLCPGSFSPIQPASDYSWHQDQNFQVKMSLRSCHTFDPNLHAIQSSSSDHSIHRNSNHHQSHQELVWEFSVGHVCTDS